MDEKEMSEPQSRNSESPAEQQIYQGGNFSQRPVSAPVPQPAAESAFNVKVIFRIILQNWIMVGLMAILGGLAGIFYIQNTVPIYQAKAELEMNVRRPKVINSDAIYEDPSASRDTDVIFNTRFAKFRSPAMEKLAASEYMKRYPDDEFTSRGEPITPSMLAVWVRNVGWYKDPSANIVKVSYSASDPVFAAKLVNVISHCAGLLMMQENRAQSDEAVKWLVLQTQEQRSVVESVEHELAQLREDLQLDSIEQQKTAIGQALVQVSEERETLISQLASRTTVYEFLRGLKVNEQSLEMLPSGLPKEKELAEMIKVWRDAHDALLQVAGRYTELHPEYRKAEEVENRSRQRLDRYIEFSTKVVENEVGLLESQIRQTEARISSMKTEAVSLEQALTSGMQQVQRLERKRDAADNSYQAVLRRMEEARLSADENMAFTKVIRTAQVPRVPISPNKGQTLVMSLFMGAGAGALLSLIMAFWSDKIGAVADLKALGLNVLTVLPSQKKVDTRGELATIILRDKFNPIVEVFSGVNAVLSSEKFAGRTKLVLMCSAGPGEGKTISACNMAICAANNGKRTLLIDGDLRRPQVANIFGLEGEQHRSLIDWLANSDSSDYQELLSRDVVENLDVISSLPDNTVTPAELLGRDRFTKLLKWARANYDRIIIDTPPLGPVGDAQILANLADSVIVVARIGKTKRRVLKYIITRFRDMDIDLLGCIANDVPHSLAGMFGGAEGYGYGYGAYKHYESQ